MNIFDAITVAGIPLLLVTLGLVQFIKGFNLEGNIVRVISMLVGLLLGLGYQLSLAIPVDFSGWFATVIFGIGLGLVASGVFDVFNPETTKVVAVKK